MIHLIYSYFIINSLIAGISIGNRDGILFIIFCLLFGLPFYSLASLYAFVFEFPIWLEKTLWLKAWYKLYFTDYFSKVTEMFIKIRTQQYKGIRINKSENFNWYQRLFMRQLDKKYNHGITKRS